MKRNTALFVLCIATIVSACNESKEWNWTDCEFYGKEPFCLSGNVVVCKDMPNPVVVEVCGEGNVCLNAACIPSNNSSDVECTHGETVCIETAAHQIYVKSCIDGYWQENLVDCTHKVCNPEHTMCIEPSVECESEDTKCEIVAGVVTQFVCDFKGTWIKSDVNCDGHVCDDEGKTCIEKVCDYTSSNGSVFKLHFGKSLCDGDLRVVCAYPNVEIHKCEVGVCVDDEGTKICVPRGCTLGETGQILEHGSALCMNNALITCFDGSLSEPVSCGEGHVCRDGETACDSGKACGKIEHLGYLCNENSDVAQCQDGQRVVIEDCDAMHSDETQRTFCSSMFVCAPAGADNCIANGDHPLIADGDYWCDGNVRRQCLDRVVSSGIECNGETPYCDPIDNTCRAYRACIQQNDGSIVEHLADVCMTEPIAKGYCDDGVLKAQENGACAEHQVCVLENESAICRCNMDEHWVADASGNCVCDGENQYKEANGICVKVDCIQSSDCPISVPENGTHWICTDNNICELAACHHGFTLNDEKTLCVCDEPYVVYEGACVPKANCRPNETYDALTNSCSCESPYVEANGNCEVKSTCKTNETYNALTNSCSCEEPYVEANGNCEVKSTCKANETYNALTNSCSCEEPYVEANGNCEHKTVCKENETYHEEDDSCTCELPYIVVNGSECKKLDAIEPEDIILFGHYEQDNDPATTNEPIEWRVLSKSSSSYYLISVKALDLQPWYASCVPNGCSNCMPDYCINKTISFHTSVLKSWLNGYDGSKNIPKIDYSAKGNNFKTKAFTEEEISIISGIGLLSRGRKISDYSSEYYLDELVQYFPKKEDRAAYATPYVAKKLGTACNGIDPCIVSWWENPAEYQLVNKYPYVYGYGYRKLTSNSDEQYKIAVRPTIHLKYQGMSE